MTKTLIEVRLEATRQHLVEMGDTTLSLLDEAIGTVAEPGSGRLDRARQLEVTTDEQHRAIHDQCLNLITLQSPVARDARFVTGALDAIVDLELIGDYALEIAALADGMRRRPPTQITTQLLDAARNVRTLLAKSVEGWRSETSAHGLSVRSEQSLIQTECRTLYDKLAVLAGSPGETAVFVDLMLIARQLERILRHAVCVADQAIAAAPLAPQR